MYKYIFDIHLPSFHLLLAVSAINTYESDLGHWMKYLVEIKSILLTKFTCRKMSLVMFYSSIYLSLRLVHLLAYWGHGTNSHVSFFIKVLISSPIAIFHSLTPCLQKRLTLLCYGILSYYKKSLPLDEFCKSTIYVFVVRLSYMWRPSWFPSCIFRHVFKQWRMLLFGCKVFC